MILTARLRIIPCDATVARAAADEPERVPALLGVEIDGEWPSDDLLEVLPAYADAVAMDPAQLGWGLWLILDRAGKSLIGDVGFKGAPDRDGTIEIGYGILPVHQGQGYATEAVQALIAKAAQQPAVRRIVATCYASNVASARVLEKTGFRFVGKDGPLLDWEQIIRD